MSRGVKCPNCGHMVTDEEKVCPNCDIFQPGGEELSAGLVLNKDRQNKQKVQKDSEESGSQTEKSEITDTAKQSIGNEAAIGAAVSPSLASKVEPTSNSQEEETSEEVIGEEEKEKVGEESTDVSKKAAMVAGIGAAASAAGMKTTSSKKSETNQSEPNPETNITNNGSNEPPKKTKGLKKIVGVIALLLLLIGGGYYGITQYQENQKLEVQKTHDKKLTKLTSEVDDLFLDKNKLFLNETFTPAQLVKLKKEVNSLGTEDKETKQQLNATLDDVEKVVDRQKEVNELFESPVIQGDKILEEVALKSANPNLPEAIAKPKDPLDEVINQAIEVATKQVDTSKKVEEKITDLFDKEGNVKKNVTKKELEAAQKELTVALAPDLKEELEEKLAKVDQTLKENEAKKAAAAKEKAAKENEIKKVAAEKEAKKAQAEKAEKEKEAKKAQAEKAEKEEEEAKKAQAEKEENPDMTENKAEQQELAETAKQAELEQQEAEAAQQEAAQQEILAAEAAKQAELEQEIAKQAEEAAKREAAEARNMEGDWSWAPGVQEKVINECLRRGYMTEGGYELRQREIINGEAYYDLYATNTNSPLLHKRNPKDVPIYLVTINAKTGWFKGDGGPNA